MRRLVSFLGGCGIALAVLLPFPAQAAWWRRAPKADFYVSPAGNDAWSGTRSRPDRAGTDGPFATIDRARQAVRKRLAQGPATPITVLIRDGTYTIEAPLTFTPADSGTEKAPVRYAAWPGEKPVVSGGRAITGWKRDDDGSWSAKIPRLGNRPWRFSQLFVKGERRPRCRMPDTGYFRSAGPITPLKDRRKARRDVSTKQGFRFAGNDLARWPDWQQMNVVIFHSWTASIHWVKAIDPKEKIVRFTAPSGWPLGYWEKNQRYYVENVRAAWNRPGEWYLDETAEVLHYLPLPGETLDTFRPVAPVAEQLLRLEGEPEIGQFVEHLTFEGIAFRHAAWNLPRDKAHDGQAAIALTGALYARGARGCVFRDIEVAHVGTYGVWFAAGCRDNLLVRSEIHDLGAGGVKIGETRTEPNPATAGRGNTVDNCFIHDGSRIARAGIGAWIGRSSYNTLRHNEICDFDYSAVSVGWSWGYAPSSANHNLVEYNHLHHIGNGVLSDMGGIYCLGISPGTVLRGNIIHDVQAYSYGGWGLYTDEGSSHILLEKNLVYDTKSGGFHQHYGKGNVVRNNIFAFSAEGQIIRSREEKHSSFTIEKNIVIFDNGQPLGGNWTNGHYTIDENLYWDITGKPFDFAGLPLEDWRDKGNDRRSLIADPKFRDIAARDFRLRASSPAATLGIEPLQDFETVGLYGPRTWRRKPAKVTHRPLDPSRKPPRNKPRRRWLAAIDDNFETTKVGDHPRDATVSGEEKGAAIRVSADTAADGKHALQFVDAAGLAHNWQPHMVYSPLMARGTAHASFAVYLKPGAILWHEWRDDASPYNVGPSLRLVDGKLETGDRELMPCPADTWIRLALTCVLGAESDGTWDLAVTLPGKPPKVFRKLPFIDKNWRRLTWFGFVSEAVKPTVFYLDKVRLNRDR